MTNATNELRQLLDERGVEWYGSYDLDETTWDVGKLTWVYVDNGNVAGLGVVQGDITPEQAIAATLGEANVDNALALLDEMNEQGRIEYSDYSRLHDAITTLGSNYGDLLPCPMCGAVQPAVQTRWIGFKHTHNGAFSAGYRGECCDCGLTTRAFNDEADAARAWNTRAKVS